MSGLHIEGSTADSSVALISVNHQTIDAASCIHREISPLAEANALIRIARSVNQLQCFQSVASKSVAKVQTT